MSATVADHLARLLAAFGFECCFGYLGHHIEPLPQALLNQGLAVVIAASETGAGYMAQGWSMASARAGLVFCEETAVEYCGKKSYHCAGIYDDKHVNEYRRINDFLRHYGTVPAIQLGHGGRKGSGRPPWEG